MTKKARPKADAPTIRTQPSDLPEGWTSAKLRDVTSPSKHKVDPRKVDPETPYIGLEHIEAHTRRIVGQATAKVAESTKAVFRAGDVLYGKLRPYLNKVCIPTFDGVCSTDILVFENRPEIDSRYLMYFLNRSQVVTDMGHAMAGAQLPRVSFDVVGDLDLPLPPLAEQTRIGDRLDTLTRQIQTARERFQSAPLILERLALSSLAAGCVGQLTEEWRGAQRGPTTTPELLTRIQRQRQASLAKKRRRVHPRFLDASLPSVDDFPDLPDVPNTWVWTSVGFAAARIQYGSSARSAANVSNGVPNLGMQNIQAGRIHLQGLKYVERASNDLPALLLQPGDLLFNRTNSPELVGKSAVFAGGLKAIFASYLVRVQVQPELAVPQFVCHWINSPWGRSWAQQVKSDGVSQSNINSTKLAEMPLPLPPLEEQKTICAKIDRLLLLTDTVGERVSRGLRHAESLVQSCFAQAFAGRLVETEASIAAREERSFESGEQLLERLKSLPVGRPSRQRAPYEVADTPIARTFAMKSLADIDRDAHLGAILRRGKKGMTPEQLLKASDLSVDDFYTQLKREVDSKRVKETRKDKKSVLLEAAR